MDLPGKFWLSSPLSILETLTTLSQQFSYNLSQFSNLEWPTSNSLILFPMAFFLEPHLFWRFNTSFSFNVWSLFGTEINFFLEYLGKTLIVLVLFDTQNWAELFTLLLNQIATFEALFLELKNWIFVKFSSISISIHKWKAEQLSKRQNLFEG